MLEGQLSEWLDALVHWSGALPTVILFLTIAVVALWEDIAPRRVLSCWIQQRWPANLSLGLINLLVLYLVLPFATVAFSVWVAVQGHGVFRLFDMPPWLAFVLGLLLLDFTRYLHHVLLHRVPVLWRFHRVHHADLDYDFSVGLRFHPFEALFTALFMFGAILLIGPPPGAVVVAEVAVAISGLVVHANGKTPRWVERYLRLLFVTPDMHRVHHSVRFSEHNSNYSAVLSIWDRLFGSYVAEPSAGQLGMLIGLPDMRGSESLTLRWCLLAPLGLYVEKPRSRSSAAGQPTTR